jgi:iron(III) transport system substrate-binding protein
MLRYESLDAPHRSHARGLLMTASAAPAQDSRVADARREGKVVWHTTLYPGIKVEVHRSGSERVLQRIMQELQAGFKNADVVNTSDTGHFVFLRRKGLLAKYTPAGAERLTPSFRDREGFA